jgi:hypothetical protein
MDYLAPFLLLAIVLGIFWISGKALHFVIKDPSPLRDMEILSGFSIATIIFSFYFVFNISLSILLIIWGILSIVCALYITKKIKWSFSPRVIYYSLFLLTPLIYFLIVGWLYGGNFITFRGNIWDWFNYNTMAVAYSKYNHAEISALILEGNHLSNIANINFTQRPSITTLPAALLSIFKVNSFILLYLFKGLLLSIFLSVNIGLIKLLDFPNKIYPFLISLCITFSMWVFYVVEIDALAQLAFMSFIPFTLYFFCKYDQITSNKIVIIASIMFGAGFIIYPELSSVVLACIFFVMAIDIVKNLLLCSKFNFYKYIYFLLPLATIAVLNYEQSLLFLMRQAVTGFTAKVDWWGYYGGYLLGPNSPVTDPNSVEMIRGLVRANGGSFYLNPEFINVVVPYVAYILPSIFGLFHIAQYSDLVIPANVVALVSLMLITCWLIKAKGRLDIFWLKIFTISLSMLMLILIARGNLWSAIKGLSFLQLALPYLLTYSLIYFYKNTFAKLALLIVLTMTLTFPVYKYSTYNSGIGFYDGFPSILHKNSKIDYEWTFDKNQFRNCSLISVEVVDPFKHHFIVLNLENYKMNYVSNLPLRDAYGFGNFIARNIQQSDPDCKIQY